MVSSPLRVGTAQPARILIVEDDDEIARGLARALEENAMRAWVAPDGEKGLAMLDRHPFDLVLLDIMLPGEDGLSLCRRIRGDRTVPIILLTAIDEEVDRILGLEMGADDYITKPFSTREVIARIRSVLRRTLQNPDGSDRKRVLRFNGWRIDPIRRQLHNPDAVRVGTTTTEFDLLLAFCRNPGRILSREELLTLTHAGLAGPIERSVDVHISRLRHKLEDNPKEPALIKTVRLGGYVFTAAVEEV